MLHLVNECAQVVLGFRQGSLFHLARIEAINRAHAGPPDPDEAARLRAMRNKQRRLMEGEW
jgi:hypothetical protein